MAAAFSSAVAIARRLLSMNVTPPVGPQPEDDLEDDVLGDRRHPRGERQLRAGGPPVDLALRRRDHAVVPGREALAVERRHQQPALAEAHRTSKRRSDRRGRPSAMWGNQRLAALTVDSLKSTRRR